MDEFQDRLFQSTPPVWGATTTPSLSIMLTVRISIHAPRVGGDRPTGVAFAIDTPFQSTPPVWGATRPSHILFQLHIISIHAPRVGGDPDNISGVPPGKHFNPRPPCGGRPSYRKPNRQRGLFQSTPPVWGATTRRHTAGRNLGISIHAPRVGGDPSKTTRRRVPARYFNPRPPCGGRRLYLQRTHDGKAFQSTPPVWGATKYEETHSREEFRDFNPRPPCGGRQMTRAGLSDARAFQSTPPVWGATSASVPAAANPSEFQSTPPVWGATC